LKPTVLSITNLGLSLRVPLVDTLDPDLKFAVIIASSEIGRSVWIPLVYHAGRYFRIGFISFTLTVPPPFDPVLDLISPRFIKKEEILLPIYYNVHNDSSGRVDLSPLLQPSSFNILLAFPGGLGKYRVAGKVGADNVPADHRYKIRLKWDDLLLGLIIDEDDQAYAYGAIEFEAPITQSLTVRFTRFTEPNGTTPLTKFAILFVLGLDEARMPINWTCADISRPPPGTARNDRPSLDERIAHGLKAAKILGTSNWKQQCALVPVPAEVVGSVVMDDLKRDLCSPEFGGYGSGQTATAAGSRDDTANSGARSCYPILAQITLPPPIDNVLGWVSVPTRDTDKDC
jgi:hypothetical protein